MQIPLEVHFQNTDPSAAVEAAVRERVAKLEKFAADILSCKVTIEAPHKHHKQGKLFHVSVDVHLPGGEIVANRDPSGHHAHEDVFVSLRDAFAAIRRQLQDSVRKRRGSVKTHDVINGSRTSTQFPGRNGRKEPSNFWSRAKNTSPA